MKDATLKACDDFTVEELVALQRKLHQAREPALEAVYRKHGDDGRRMSAFGVFTENLQELENLWAKELKVVKEDPALMEVSRDTKCHESVMWMVHHVSQEKQATLR